MPGFAAAGGSDRAPRAFEMPPFQETDLKAGAVYALGVETAAARLPLLLLPLQAALWAGRPCVLITRLDPQEAPFADVLAQARRMVAASGGGAERLQVFTAIGDYEVNLFLHGAERYLQELEQFEIAPGSLLLIDEADDLYTPHDHGALVQQARAYQSWCKRGGHTMVQLHLRTGVHRPLLEGNQAAAQYLSGMARVTSHADGLAMVIDFWETAAGLRTGSVVALRPLLAPFGRAAEAALPPLWYVGQRDADLENWRRDFDVRTAASLAELLPWRGDDADGNGDSGGKRGAEGEGLSIIVTLTSLDRFAAFVEQLTALRAAIGRQARIVVRESRYRLREHTQKRLLLRVGVDSIWPASQPLEELIPLLKQPRLEPVGEWVDGNGNGNGDSDAAEPWAPEAHASEDAGWLCGSAFVDEIERRLRPGLSSRVPCALAEVDFEGLPALDAVSAAKGALLAGRKGDLTTSTGGAQFFFLHGCRGRDVVHVVTRCMEDALAHRIRRIHLYTGESAIADRLLQLRQQANAEAMLATEPEDKATNNVVSMPAAARAGQPRGHVSMAMLAAVAAALSWPACEALAQGQGAVSAMASPTVAATSAQAYERGDYAEAARLGLTELERNTTNPELRLRVANSLAWTGQYGQAIRQYESLADTPLAAQASVGLGNVYLWSGRAHLADPLFRRALNTDPANADALRGLAATARQLRPRTTVRGEWLDDSGRTERSTALVSQRWRDAGLAQIFEVSGERVEEGREPDGPDLRPRKLSFGYQNLGWAGAPKLQLTSDTGVKSSVYGKLGVQLAEGAVTVEIGRVNWGELAFDPNARRDGLSARRLSVAGRADAGIGAFSGSAAHFAVSDGNRVHEFNAQYTPAWQPFPAASGLRALVGVYGRKSERRDPRYWSPTQYYVGQFGLSLNRSGADWDLGAELKRSLRIGGEGTQGWTVGLTGTRWLSRDWALRAEGFHIETRRDNSGYRAKSIAVSLDRVW